MRTIELIPERCSVCKNKSKYHVLEIKNGFFSHSWENFYLCEKHGLNFEKKMFKNVVK